MPTSKITPQAKSSSNPKKLHLSQNLWKSNHHLLPDRSWEPNCLTPETHILKPSNLTQEIEDRRSAPIARVTLDGIKSDSRSVLIAEPNDQGGFDIICVVPQLSDSVYDALVKSAAKQITLAKDEAAILNQEAVNFEGAVAVNERQALVAA